MTRRGRRGISGLLRMLCALALLSLSFAHKPPLAMAALVESASLQLPDGSYADLCVGEAAVKHEYMIVSCDACRLSGTTLLPTPGDGAWLLSACGLAVAAFKGEAAVVAQLPIDRLRSRAPPLIS